MGNTLQCCQQICFTCFSLEITSASEIDKSIFICMDIIVQDSGIIMHLNVMISYVYNLVTSTYPSQCHILQAYYFLWQPLVATIIYMQPTLLSAHMHSAKVAESDQQQSMSDKIRTVCVLNVVECTHMHIYWHNACINTLTHTQSCNTGGDKHVVTLGANTTSENDDLQKLVELQMSARIMWTNTVNYVAWYCEVCRLLLQIM